MHPVDDLLSMGLSGLMFGFVVGVFQYLDPANPGPAVILGLHVAIFAYYLAGFNLRHSHAWLDYRGVLGQIFISPAQHQIHHSTDPRHAGKNLGFIFSFWDAANGSLWRPAGRERLRFGLADSESRDYTGLRQLYFLPFARVLAGAAPRAGLVPLGVVLAGTIALSLGVLLQA
jgi:sterol desaturase/sphingolipid hydroxylase (fatty acid hydroxylase superfamily)